MSQLQPFNPDVVPADQYTQEKGKFIAECYASGDKLRDICNESEGWLPSMLEVRRWRSMFPAFDALMIEAGACRAENMAEDIVDISDDTTEQAAHNRNRMAAREKLAGWMAPSSYGGHKEKAPGDSEAAPVYALTDEQLLAIAAGKLAAPIEGECKRLEAEGVHPPVDHAPRTEYEVSGNQKPGANLADDSVTTRPESDMESLTGELPDWAEHSVTTNQEDTPGKILEPGETVRSFIGMDE